MTFKEISDRLLDNKAVGNETVGWMYLDRYGDLVASGEDPTCCDDCFIGFLFCSCDELEVRERGLI